MLPIVGLADDALVLSWLATRLVEETEAFLEWEKGIVGAPADSRGGAAGGTTYPPAGGPTGASDGASRPAGGQTVPGNVVR